MQCTPSRSSRLRRLARLALLASASCVVLACGDDAGGGSSDSSAGTGASTGQGGSDVSSGGQGGGASQGGGAGESAGGAGGGADGGSGGAGADAWQFDFEGPDADPWPEPWTISGGVLTADLQQGRARLLPVIGPPPYPLARMHLADDVVDSEIVFTVEFTSVGQQGLGFYARQNGGHLEHTDPPGEGYAVFVSGGLGFGLWYEEDGDEVQLTNVTPPLSNGVRYRVRFRVTQQGASETLLQAKLWPEAETEPSSWDLEATDTHAHLQQTAGGFAVDAYYGGDGTPPDLFLDDVLVQEL